MSSPRPPSLRSLRRRARSLHAFPALASLALLMPLAAQAAMPRVHAIVGARIVTAPGKAIERGTIVMLPPRRGAVSGQSAVIGLGDGAPNLNVLTPEASQVVALEPERQGYPGSLMGAIAVIRKAFLDARWYADVRRAYAKSPQGKPRPETNESWEALQPLVGGTQPALFVADDM